jgi:UDPglucose 6-dehydrogenase
LIDLLTSHGAQVRAYDPQAGAHARRLYSDNSRLTVCDQRADTLENAHGLVVVTEWNEFRSPDFNLIKGALAEPVVFDGRNLYDPDYLKRLGFKYYAIGRGS